MGSASMRSRRLTTAPMSVGRKWTPRAVCGFGRSHWVSCVSTIYLYCNSMAMYDYCDMTLSQELWLNRAQLSWNFHWKDVLPWASYQINDIAGCACAGNAGNVPPPPPPPPPPHRIQRKPRVTDPGMCRDAWRDCLPAVAGKTFPAFPTHAHPQFYVFGKRPIGWQNWCSVIMS